MVKKNDVKSKLGMIQEIGPETKKPKLIYINSGSTLLNCALSDNARGGYGAGKICNIIGENAVGKTLKAETMLALAANNPELDEYELILDDAEHALEINISKLFGQKAASRIKAPNYDSNGLPKNSETVEECYANIWRKIQEGKPFIYCLDSLDSLADAADYERAAEHVKVADGNKKEVSGSYGMTKPKLLSEMFRTIKSELAKTNSLLLILSQTRDKIGFTGYGAKKVRSGGKALDFYCSNIIWLTAVKTLKQGKKDMEEVVGKSVEAHVSKNKLTGKIRDAHFNIYYDYGIDDIGSCVDFILQHGDGITKTANGFYQWPEQGIATNTRLDNIIKHIEENNLQETIIDMVQKAWDQKEDSLKLGRKPRFE